MKLIVQILIGCLVIWIWNRFLIKPLLSWQIDTNVKRVSETNEFNNFFWGWMVTHKLKFIKAVQGFYWLAIIIPLSMELLNYLKIL